MTRMMLTGMGTVFGLALVSAIVMVANAPASTRTVGDNPFEIGAAAVAPENQAGRLIISFEPAADEVDRN